jgi:ABC-2 type transport system permease protein
LVKDIHTLFAVINCPGVFNYAPAMVSLFPELPRWIAKVFPTYYITGPVTELSPHGATCLDMPKEMSVAIGLILALVACVAVIARRTRHQRV